MACRAQDSGVWSAVELIAEKGFAGLPEALTALINEAMRLERERHLGVGPYERGPERRGHANGYKPKTVRTRVGELDLAVPQVRNGSFYPTSLERGLRSSRSLTAFRLFLNMHQNYSKSELMRKCTQILAA